MTAPDPHALVAAALYTLLLKWGPGRHDAHYKEEARKTVLEFLKEYPAIGAALQLRDAGMRVMQASANMLNDTVLSPDMVVVVNEALEAAGAWEELMQGIEGVEHG
ncbi:MAG: hypothetical protein ABIY63_06805 [Fibrobacteria bacterium]